MARLSLALVTCMGCLVTDNAQIPAEENFPPSIISPSDARTMGVALDQIIDVDLDEFEGSELVIPVVIRDPNVNQELEFQVYLDFTGNPFDSLISDPDATFMPTGTLERSVTIRVPIAMLQRGCRKIELRVSSQFDGSVRFREPVDPVDIDQAVWWVRVVDDMNRDGVELGSCL